MAADLSTSSDEKGVIRIVSSTPPSHYTIKLQGFSSFAKNNIEKYSTAEFEVEGYKWNLILYPNGNKSKNVNDNISVYLRVADNSLPNLMTEVHVIFRAFLFNQNNDNYYTLQESRRFHKMKLEWGFDQFIPLDKFNDPSNGYLVNDTCVFGAEIYVSNKNNGKGEQLVMKNYVDSYKHIWKIDNFSTLSTKDAHFSMTFNSGDQKWKLRLYPKGSSTGTGSHISIYLCLANSDSLTVSSQIHAEFTIRIIDQDYGKNLSYKSTNWFNKSCTAYGWHKFISLTDLNASSKGFLVKDKCIIEAEVTVHGVTTAL